jgi:hypothetical protein
MSMVMQAMYLSAVPLSPQRTGALAVLVIRNPSLDKKSTFCAFLRYGAGWQAPASSLTKYAGKAHKSGKNA